MGKVTFTGADDNPVGREYSTARGAVMRSEKMEVARVFFAKGKGAHYHSHPEEQIFFVSEGRLQVTLGEGADAETYIAEQGDASFHPSNVPHKVIGLEDTVCVSFKNLVDPSQSPNAVRNVYIETGRLDA
jgi:quercetin dioxygenase-like cupin family protein